MRYPKRLFNINENITRNNISDYERMLDKMHKARKEEEKKMGRRMTIKERLDFRDNFEKCYYLWHY